MSEPWTPPPDMLALLDQAHAYGRRMAAGDPTLTPEDTEQAQQQMDEVIRRLFEGSS